ncbi:hypothetical protein PMAYCL1PPCAC_28955, partial [Pristionchus mayeri]
LSTPPSLIHPCPLLSFLTGVSSMKMSVLILFSFFVFSLLIFPSSSYPTFVNQNEEPDRLCGTEFLSKSSNVLKTLERHGLKAICEGLSGPKANWYRVKIDSNEKFIDFCCKVGCGTIHHIDFICFFS